MADITRPIEPFELTQGFGENPSNYAKFGLAGHNGWDIKTKLSDTPLGHRDILSSWLSEFYKQGIDPSGYGDYFEVVVKLKSTWKLTYAHCLSIQTFKTRGEGESMAISDNTGNSTGAHLHLTVKKIKIVNGVHETQDYNNGYFGAVNPQVFFDELRKYKTAGTAPQPVEGLIMQVDEETFTRLRTKSDNRDELFTNLKVPLDPVEPKAEKAIAVIEGLRNVATGLQRQLNESDIQVANYKEKADRIEQSASATAKTQQDRITALEAGQISFEKERESLKGQIEQFARDKGVALIEAGQWKTKYDQEKQSNMQSILDSLSPSDIFSLFVKKFFRVKIK